MPNTKQYLFFAALSLFTSAYVNAESLRCNGSIVDIEDTKAEVINKCGNPEIMDTFCEKMFRKVIQSDGNVAMIESCENVDIWTYNPGKGQFWTNLYFAQGKLREMRYGDRVK